MFDVQRIPLINISILGTAVRIPELNVHTKASFYMPENSNKVQQQYYIKQFKSQRLEVQWSFLINWIKLTIKFHLKQSH